MYRPFPRTVRFCERSRRASSRRRGNLDLRLRLERSVLAGVRFRHATPRVRGRGGRGVAWREASDVFTYLLAFAGIWAVALPAIVAARQRQLNLTAKTLALAPLYYVLVSCAAWIAIFDLAVRPHFWAKTEHGRARAPAALAPVPDALPT